MAQDLTKRVLLGKVTGAHGIRGDVTVHAYTTAPADLASYGQLSDESGVRRFEIISLRATPKNLVVRFKGIAGRTQAEALRGVELFVDRSALPQAEQGSYYHVDLIGLRALDAGSAEIGRIVAVQDFGGGTLLEIRKSGSNQTELIPFTDTFVPTVDIAAGHVVVIVPNMIGEPENQDVDNEGDQP